MLLVMGIVCLSVMTWRDLQPVPNSLTLDQYPLAKIQVVDRHYQPLTITYQNRWNWHDQVPLYRIPIMIQQAFISAEDQRFYQHAGVDWLARLHAIWQNMLAARAVRGASTITEQVVKLLHPRPRTIWSRWLEGFEAMQLEQKVSKADILEFYLNQVPYSRQRRGIVQAARLYFDRDLSTLNMTESLILAILVRAPGRLDPLKHKIHLQAPLQRLTQQLLKQGMISRRQAQHIKLAHANVQQAQFPIQAQHFVQYLIKHDMAAQDLAQGRLQTTLDAHIQQQTQALLDQRLIELRQDQVAHAAALVIDHQQQHILAWVNSGQISQDIAGSYIDKVTMPRQPGSTLKPFLYGLALEKGWTAATLIDDSPLTEAFAGGLHQFHNYSRLYYGLLPLRQALGNSLNIPAVRTIQFVGTDAFLARLHQLGMYSLKRHPAIYGNGLALGNGEVSLLELVQAYSVLARQGYLSPLKMTMTADSKQQAIFSPEVSTLIANILSDPEARRLEFGAGNILRFPVQTAVKTGTSNDYRDAWAVGFNYRYTVGVWMGNLDRQPMKKITGARGPAFVLRALFAMLNQDAETQPLWLSPRLVRRKICQNTLQLSDGKCPTLLEWFIPGTEPSRSISNQAPKQTVFELQQPTPGLQLAMDPRIPDELEGFALVVPDKFSEHQIDWLINGQVVGKTQDKHQFIWSVVSGTQVAQARVWLSKTESLLSQSVPFTVH